MKKIQTKKIQEMTGFLSQFGFDRNNGLDTPLTYCAKWSEIRGEQKGYNPNLKAFELALLTIQENGSAPRDYESTSESQVIQVPFAIGSYQSNGPDNGFLIVSDMIDEKGELIRPAKLKLNDLIGYESIKRFE